MRSLHGGAPRGQQVGGEGIVPQRAVDERELPELLLLVLVLLVVEGPQKLAHLLLGLGKHGEKESQKEKKKKGKKRRKKEEKKKKQYH